MRSAASAREGLRGAALPIFVVLLMVLGGGTRGAFWANAALQMLSACAIAWCILDTGLPRLSRPARLLLGLFGCLMAVSLLQLVPLPAEIWSQLPGRETLAEDFSLFDEKVRALPLSLAPDDTMFGVFKFLPALAAFFLTSKLNPQRDLRPLCLCVLLTGTASVLLGIAQMLTGREGGFYFFEITNWDQPVGFMANVNHQASLLLMTLPFGAVLVSKLITDPAPGEHRIEFGLMVIGLLASVVSGIMIAGSMTVYGLLIPVILLSFLIGRAKSSGPLTLGTLFSVSLFIAGVALVVSSGPVGLGGLDLSQGTLSRPDTWARTLDAIRATMPFGSGLGSFEWLFPHFEDPSQVTSTFMNHAHNDYLELTLEYGLAGPLLLTGFFAWLVWRVVSIWRAPDTEPVRLQRAASVVLLIVVVHSCVDYPARTAAISGLAGLCLGLMAACSDSPRGLLRSTGALVR